MILGTYAEPISTNYRRVQMGLFDRFKRTSKESLLGYLQNSISDNSSLEHIVSMFEEMCNMPLKEDMILFETGTYSFTGKLSIFTKRWHWRV